jgi:PST family polysaccharide transporter
VTSKSSYAQILKASSIMGGAAGINLLLGMLRVKFAAVFIGTTGVGLISSFGALQGLIGTLAGLGIQSSAVREIAAAVGKGDEQAVGRAVLALRRICWLTGLVGMAAMMLLAPWLSQLTFGHRDYTLDIAALGLIILFGNLSGGQMALIQGMRRIGDMARANIYGAAAGTVAAIGFYAALGLRGIIPTLLAVSAIQLALSFHFARRVPVPKVSLTWRQTFAEASGMVRLGVVMMSSGLMSSAVSYFTVTLITQHDGTQAVGLYSAGFALSGMFVNFVLGAMGADYYPRLTGAIHDKPAMNRMVNEQAEIAILLAIPGLLATVIFAPLIIQLFYTKEFIDAVPLIQWFTLGCLGRVISWPLGFVMLALGKGLIFGAAELTWHVTHAILIYFLFSEFGLKGVAAAFAALYVIVTLHALFIANRLTQFRFSKAALQSASLSLVSLSGYLLIAEHIAPLAQLLFGSSLLTIVSIFSFMRVSKNLPPEHLLNRTARSLFKRA